LNENKRVFVDFVVFVAFVAERSPWAVSPSTRAQVVVRA